MLAWLLVAAGTAADTPVVPDCLAVAAPERPTVTVAVPRMDCSLLETGRGPGCPVVDEVIRGPQSSFGAESRPLARPAGWLTLPTAWSFVPADAPQRPPYVGSPTVSRWDLATDKGPGALRVDVPQRTPGAW